MMTINICMVSIGSRGDLEPYLALSWEWLQHHKNVAIHLVLQPNWASLAQPLNELYPNQFHLHLLPFTNHDFYKVPRRKSAPNDDVKLKNVHVLADIVAHLILPIKDQLQVIVRECDVLISSALARSVCLWIAHQQPSKRLQLFLLLHLQPLVPNPLFPSYRVSRTRFVQSIVEHQTKHNANTTSDTNDDYVDYNQESYWKIDYPLEQDELVMQRMAELGMTPTIPWDDMKAILSGNGSIIGTKEVQFWMVNAYSSQLEPPLQGTDGVGPYVYDLNSPLADHYLSPGGPTVLPHGLQEFLSHHDRKPIAIGFGSMPVTKQDVILEVVQELSSDHCFVLIGRSLRPNAPIPNVYWIESIPYALLLPQCTTMVCHGGAGVVQATLRAGIPSVVCPLMGDQFAWAGLVHALGLGIHCCTNLATMTKDDLVTSIQNVTTDLQEHCRDVGRMIRSDEQTNGTAAQRMIQWIHQRLDQPTPTPSPALPPRAFWEIRQDVNDLDWNAKTNENHQRHHFVVATTDMFRKFANQLYRFDGKMVVLEIGCANGYCTREILKNRIPPSQVIACDISRSFIQECQANVGSNYPKDPEIFHQIDVMMEWPRMEQMVRSKYHQLSKEVGIGKNEYPLLVFVDIGGNREIESLLALLQVIERRLQPRHIIVKSKALYKFGTQHDLNEETSWKNLKSMAIEKVVQRQQSSTSVGKKKKYHPLKMPQRYHPSTPEIAICRYHNYDQTKGCLLYRDTKKLGKGCALDHEHCHSCLQPGHVAWKCPSFTASSLPGPSATETKTTTAFNKSNPVEMDSEVADDGKPKPSTQSFATPAHLIETLFSS